MPNAPVQAAAEGLPSLTRRGFLARLGLTAGAASVALTATAVASAVPVSENEELLALGEQMLPAVTAVVTAKEALAAAVDLFHRTRPVVPDELQDRTHWIDYERQRGTGITPSYLKDGYDQTIWHERGAPVMYVSAEAFRERLGWCDKRTAMGRRYKRLLLRAERYEQEDAAARSASCIESLSFDLDDRQHELSAICERIFTIPASTMVGIELKASVVAAAPHLDRYGHRSCQPLRWGPLLAEDLIAVLRRA